MFKCIIFPKKKAAFIFHISHIIGTRFKNLLYWQNKHHGISAACHREAEAYQKKKRKKMCYHRMQSPRWHMDCLMDLVVQLPVSMSVIRRPAHRPKVLGELLIVIFYGSSDSSLNATAREDASVATELQEPHS